MYWIKYLKCVGVGRIILLNVYQVWNMSQFYSVAPKNTLLLLVNYTRPAFGQKSKADQKPLASKNLHKQGASGKWQ